MEQASYATESQYPSNSECTVAVATYHYVYMYVHVLYVCITNS